MWLQRLAVILGALGFSQFREPERIILQLPLSVPDASLFKVSKFHKKRVYSQYIIRPKYKTQTIGVVKYGSQSLFDMPTRCDADLVMRAVVVTINGNGVLVKIHSAKKKDVDIDVFLIDTHNIYKMVWHWDYIRFVNPHKYSKRTHLSPFPVSMEIFTPVFKSGVEDKIKYMALNIVVEAAVKRAEALQIKSHNKGTIEVKGLNILRTNFIASPTEAIYNSAKRLYREEAKNNYAKGIKSIFRRADTSGAKNDCGCVLTTRVVEEYMNLQHQGNRHIKKTVIGA